MSTLFSVRHGQASFLADNYDELSDLGCQQAQLLGDYWAARGVVFDEVYSGPRQRQRHTAELVGQQYLAAGRDFPKIQELAEFDEYDAETVMRQALPELIESSPEIRKLHEAFVASSSRDEQLRTFQRVYEMVIRRWIRGELSLGDVEPWETFSARVGRGLEKIVAGPSSRRVAVFTSGGPIGVTMRRALNVDHEVTLQLAWMVRNGSFSEFIFSGSRFTLSGFNLLPHLDDPQLQTYR